MIYQWEYNCGCLALFDTVNHFTVDYMIRDMYAGIIYVLGNRICIYSYAIWSVFQTWSHITIKYRSQHGQGHNQT